MPTALQRCALALLACLPACAGTFGGKFHPRGAHEHETRCARAVMGRNSPYRMPLADPIADEEGLKLLEGLPPEARRTARAAGLEPVIASLMQRKAEQPPPNDLLLRYQELALRMTAFDAQVSSLAFELGCTRERVRDMVMTLDSEESSRQLLLAASSLIIGAGTSTVAGTWDLLGKTDTEAPAWLAVGGGMVTAVLGATALLVPERVVLLEHQQNLLRPILEGKDPDHLYPSFVFRMLTARYQGDDGTPRDALMRDFEDILAHKVEHVKHARALEILGGTGSFYPREMLEAREAFLHAVELAVAGVARDLELFDRTVVRLFATPPAPPPRGWP
ncbi:MAG: hypothetical protein ABW352_13295 [Polyangiales bacterium]